MENDAGNNLLKAKGINRLDHENAKKVFRAGDLYNSLGLTRETIRHYEKIGLLKPRQNKDNNYREFSTYDFTRLLIVDFYKKRGLTLSEIHQIIEGLSLSEIYGVLERKRVEIENKLREEQRILKMLQETSDFHAEFESSLNVFSIRKAPVYEILGELSAITAFEEYPEKALGIMDQNAEDLFGKMLREITFDRTGYTGTKMYIVNKLAPERKAPPGLLDIGSCMYTVTESGRFNDADDAMIGEIHERGYRWADAHNVKLKGVVYINIALVAFQDQKERLFFEAWAPIEED
ncbi:DNA-binding transcriptional regulator, MerR family [Sporobacter termitidis DSM 10068]|uniref:DNA-binding transcriptional regulator, MerR family n=1 Tax=Sporobacter termitidis DSM 10068 TaxID=1123282 RepID=A0A1M5VD83_9FIRM|nr:MerR family transcriptional regulator [Sporobacter termitidis]SHH73187.1 DNA-binding transcriptional regulator, MerR family [Sporobacter termitidis DSM 10068]